MFDIMEAIYDTCPDTYIRPDHGRMIWDEKGRPGYGLYDRALGATYLNGLWEAICRMKGEKSNTISCIRGAFSFGNSIING